MENGAAEILQRLRTSRSAVQGSPFYSAAQKEAVLFTLDLIEFGEVLLDPTPNMEGAEG